MTELVPGRECGTCNVCCVAPSIDKPDIQKAAGAVCRNSSAAGCAIYASRPDVCQVYYCGWRRLNIFPDDWRPDKSGVLAELDINNIPPHFSTNYGIILVLVGNPLKTIRQSWFCDFVVRGVRDKVPLTLALPGPVGMQSGQLPLNTAAMIAATQQSRA